jgi:hypothetical protein
MLRHYQTDQTRDQITGAHINLTYRMVDWEDGRTDTQAVAMPPETLAIRAGEYGLDPADTQLLLDVVLHETFISYPDHEHPLWTAESIALAREQHLDTVATVRHEHAERRKGERRPKEYPTLAVHRAALGRAVELSPMHAPVVDAGRRLARAAWMQRQAGRDAIEVDATGRPLTQVELAVRALDRPTNNSRRA